MEKNHIKIIGFSQLRNEHAKGNLRNWLKQMFQVCEYVYVYDQNSTDGSQEIYKEYKNLHVIYSNKNRFSEEITCKGELLNKVLTEHPDTHYLFWVDGDTLVDGKLLANNGSNLQNLCHAGIQSDIDGFKFEHYNLWRSDIYYRVDDKYHDLNGGVCALWRNNGRLSYPTKNGLHHQQWPNGIDKIAQVPFGLIHRGFATDYQIITKYKVYGSRGQSGWALDRLLNEEGLTVKKLPDYYLPEWFQITDDVHPQNKKRMREVYEENN